MHPQSLLQQVAFIKEIDKLKYIQRKTKLFNKGMEKERTQNFQNLITAMSDKYEQEHQIIFTTSMISDELNNKPYCVGEEYDRNNKTLNV